MLRLKDEIEELQTKMGSKEERLSTQFKMLSKIVSEYENETEDMIHKLKKIRDEQVKLIWAILINYF